MFEIGNCVYYAGFEWVVTHSVEKRDHNYYGLNNLSLEIPDELLLPALEIEIFKNTSVTSILVTDKNTDKLIATLYFYGSTLSDNPYSFVKGNDYIPYFNFSVKPYWDPQEIHSLPPISNEGELKELIYGMLKEKKGQEGFSFTGTVEDYLKYGG